jgi:hypothetical protein
MSRINFGRILNDADGSLKWNVSFNWDICSETNPWKVFRSPERKAQKSCTGMISLVVYCIEHIQSFSILHC